MTKTHARRPRSLRTLCGLDKPHLTMATTRIFKRRKAAVQLAYQNRTTHPDDSQLCGSCWWYVEQYK